MKIGIVVDNYKLRRFRRALDKGEFINREEKPFMEGVSAFFIYIDESRFNELRNICKKIEIDIKRSN